MNHLLRNESDNVIKATCTVGISRKVLQKVHEFIDHGIVGRCIVTGDAETLRWGKISELICFLIINVHRLLTFLDIPKSSRTFANATARLMPEQDAHRLTILLEMDSNSNERLVVWRRPCIGGKAQVAVVFLEVSHILSLSELFSS
jgi:hypothetical protein